MDKNDTISRQSAIDELKRISFSHWFECGEYLSEDTKEIKIISSSKALKAIETLPPAHPTLYGYKIEHLSVIAEVLQKEGLPPDRVVDALTDIGRIISIVIDEFEESLRNTTLPDLSGYSDKLWRSAYERGKADAKVERRTDE